MKTEEDYILYKLGRAEESLKASKVLYENNYFEEAISRLYYSAFYAVSALLIKKKLNPKSHKGVKALFHKEFIFTNIVDKSYGEFYDNLMAKRSDVDYDNFPLINKELIPSQIEMTENLIKLVKEKIELK